MKKLHVMMKKENLEPLVKLMIGNLVMSFAYAKWMKPDAIINGGGTSISMIVNKATGLPFLYVSNGLAVLLLGLSWYFLGRRNFLNSVLGSVFYNVFFSFFYLWNVNVQINLPVDFILATVLIGVGYYCCISANASVVGMDVLALIAHKKNPKRNVAKTLRQINLVVLAFGLLVYGLKSVIVGVLFSYAHSFVLNKLLAMDKKWNNQEEIQHEY